MVLYIHVHIYLHIGSAWVAQLVEHLPRMQEVMGSKLLADMSVCTCMHAFVLLFSIKKALKCKTLSIINAAQYIVEKSCLVAEYRVPYRIGPRTIIMLIIIHMRTAN